MKKGLFTNIFIFILSMCVIIIAVFLASDARNTVYEKLFLLPLLHGIIMFIFFPETELMLRYPGQKIIYILFFIRNVVTPLLLAVNNYNLGIIIRNKNDINYAIFLMTYETFMVFLVLARKIRLFKVKRIKKNYMLDRGVFVQNTFDILLVLLTAVTILLWLTVAEFRRSYESIFNLNNLIQVANNVIKDDLATSTRALSTVGGLLLTFCRIFVTLWILYKIRMFNSHTCLGIFVALIISFIQMLFIGAQLMFAFYMLLFVYFTVTKLWPDSKTILQLLFGFTIISGIFWIAFVKGGFISLDSFFKNLGNSLQAYLPGVANVAGTLRIEKTNILKTGFADMYTMIPFRNTLFGLNVENLSDLFNKQNRVAGQIMPLIGEANYYLGPLLAPIFSMLFAQGAIWANERMDTAKHIFSFGTYTMFMLYFSTMLICKNFILFGSTFTSTLLPMVIMCKLVKNNYDFSNLEGKSKKRNIEIE